MKKKQRIYAFIDASNLFYGGKKSLGLRKKRSGVLVLTRDIQRVKFYQKLKGFGYRLRIKAVKTYRKKNGSIEKKANCDVDMTFEMMKFMDEYSGAVVLSGDGDFAAVLAYLRKQGKGVTVLARGERTSREIRQLVGSDFRDFNYLRELLRFEEGAIKKRRLI